MERKDDVKKIVVIDADSIIYQVGWSVKGTENIELGKTSLNDYIYKIMRDTEATHYIGFVQTKSMNFRYDVYPEYKAKRPKADDWLKFWKPIFLQVMYEQWGFINPSEFNVESDDCMQAAFSALSQVYNPEEEIVMAYIDKDLNNIYADHAAAHIYYNYSQQNRGWFRVRQERSKFFFWRQMIMGDASDGLPGIFKKGKVFAEKLLLPNQENPRAMFYSTYREYLKHYKLEGRKMFCQMRDCMRLKDDIDGFNCPDPIPVPDLEEKLFAEVMNI